MNYIIGQFNTKLFAFKKWPTLGIPMYYSLRVNYDNESSSVKEKYFPCKSFGNFRS